MKTCEEIKERTRRLHDLVSSGSVGEEQARTIILDFTQKLRDIKDQFDERYKVLYEFAAEKGAI